jgi:competence protein ComEC
MLFNAYCFQIQWQQNGLDEDKLSSTKQFITGEVISLHTARREVAVNADKAPRAKNNIRFNIRVTHINSQKLQTAIQLRLTWKSPSFTLQQGQVVRLNVKFKPAHGLANLGGFSYQTWLNSKSISGTGYVVNHKQNGVLETSNSIRQQLYNRYQAFLPKHELAPLLLALGFGAREGLSKDLWRVLQATGTGHLIAISGLHIGLVATGSYFIIMLLFRVLPFKLLFNTHRLQVINARYFAIGVSMLIGLSYGYLAGFSLPTTRALLMLITYWGIRLLSLKVSIKRWLIITLSKRFIPACCK